ncbi:acyl-CoA dehydrogenase family protein [Sphingoaurantiacus capsulatus]|uniref:Acyl-CoA dehydrogenase family protein n=1 Tax=Sphingoaurantiacus capsulatus TaxID=1771310 RepID=A0ABV7X6X7_9SPHN
MTAPHPDVADLAPKVAARAEEIEAARRLPADLAAELAAAGLFRLVVPKSLGGLELPPGEVVATIEAMAQADASVAWCLMIAATTGLTSAYLPREIAAEVFADPNVITGGVFAPMGKAVVDGDDYVVSGRWSWGSGTANCAWIVGGSLIFEDSAMRLLPSGQPDHRMMVMPRADVELIDTWHSAGLKGTGSGDFAVEELRVPRARSVSLIVDAPVEKGPLYAFPAFGLLALGIAAVAAGNARAALDEVKAALASKRAPGSKRTAAERGAVQVEVAKSEARLRAARAFLYGAIAEAWEIAQATGSIDLDTRAELRLAATHMTRTAAEVTREAYDLGGGAALFLSNPLQRRFRDAHAMTQHMMVSPATYELTGRVLLGLPTDASTL